MKKRKKILYIVTKSVWGGAQRYVFDLATHLAEDAFDIVVACGPSGELIERLERARIRVIALPVLKRDIHFVNEIRSFFSILKILTNERPDVIHLNSSKAGGIGAAAGILYKCISLRFGVRIIFTVHGWAFLEDRPHLWRTVVFIGSCLSSLLQNTIIVISRNDFERARGFIPLSKLVLIPNGIGRIQFDEPVDARMVLSEKTHSSIPQGQLLIGTIAELTATKGLSHLLHAVKLMQASQRVKPFSIIIIGGGEDHMRLADEIKQQNLERIVFLAGAIPHAAQYLPAFDIFVLPSLKEGLPYAVLEAMAAGLPIVASAVGGIPDLLGEGNGILVQPKDSHALAEALLTLMNEKGRRNQLGKNAEETVKRFSLERMLDRTTNTYSIL